MNSYGSPIPLPSLRGKKLRNACLAYANFSGEDLSGLDLSGANLTGAYLVKAHLKNTKLRGACLEKAILCEAVMDKTDCRGAIFVSANLQKLQASCTNFSKADFTSANLSEAIFTGCSFPQAQIRFTNLKDALFERCTMPQAMLYHATMSHTRFCSMSLEKAKTQGCLFEDAILEDVSLPKPSLSHDPFPLWQSISALGIALSLTFGWMAFSSEPLLQTLARQEQRLQSEELALQQKLAFLKCQIRFRWKELGNKPGYDESQNDPKMQTLLQEWRQYHSRLAHIAHEQSLLQKIRLKEIARPLEEAMTVESIEAYEQWRKEEK